jgi:plastocyanin
VRSSFFGREFLRNCCALAALALAGNFAAGQDKPVTVQVKIQRGTPAKVEKSAGADLSQAVVWLVPLDPAAAKEAAQEKETTGKRPQVVQKNKSFQPHLTVVRVGSVVDFPNRDPFFHNVFSMFDGKRFDLGLYEAGATNSVHFDHPGVSFLFCNIHPEMSAVVVAVDTPYYAVTDKSGGVSIANVPNGKYELHVWYERSLPKELKNLARTVQVSQNSRDLGIIVVPEDSAFSTAHKNKYGQDYAPPPKQGYSQP